MGQDYFPLKDLPIFINDLSIRLYREEARDSNLRPNQVPVKANDVNWGTVGLTHKDIEILESGFRHNPDHVRNVRNSYQAITNQNR